MKKSKREKQENEDKGVCSPMLICLERWKEREAGDVGTCLNVHECLAMLICPEKEREKGGRGFRQTYMDVKEWSPMITWPEREEEGGLGFMYVLFNVNLEKEGVQQSLYEFVWVFLRRRRGLFQVSRVTVLFISTSSIVNWMFFSSFTGAFFSELDCFCNEILGHRSVLYLFPWLYSHTKGGWYPSAVIRTVAANLVYITFESPGWLDTFCVDFRCSLCTSMGFLSLGVEEGSKSRNKLKLSSILFT